MNLWSKAKQFFFMPKYTGTDAPCIRSQLVSFVRDMEQIENERMSLGVHEELEDWEQDHDHSGAGFSLRQSKLTIHVVVV
jgi:hypothetical protein